MLLLLKRDFPRGSSLNSNASLSLEVKSANFVLPDEGTKSRWHLRDDDKIYQFLPVFLVVVVVVVVVVVAVDVVLFVLMSRWWCGDGICMS